MPFPRRLLRFLLAGGRGVLCPVLKLQLPVEELPSAPAAPEPGAEAAGDGDKHHAPWL